MVELVKSSHRHSEHNPVGTSMFSWRQFWVSFIYENLPPILFSPLAAILIERRFSRAWNVCQHRNLMAVSTRHNPWSFIIFSWLIVYPGSWLINVGMLMAIFTPQEMIAEIDPLQMLCAYAFLFCRRIIVCVKYGYFDKADYSALSQPAPKWTWSKSTQKLIAVGWGKPKQFPGLIKAELALAESMAGVALAPLQLSRDTGTARNLQDATLDILDSAYGKELPKQTNLVILASVLLILISFIVTKHLTGVPLLGHTVASALINLGTYTAILSGMGIMGFGLMCALDFSRRKMALMLLDAGLFNTQESGHRVNADLKTVFDPMSPNDLRCWVVAREVLRKFGERYYLRVQSYTSILLCFSFLCVAFLNFLAWTGTEHHISTVVLLASNIVVIATIGSVAMRSAILLQDQSQKSRSQLLAKILSTELNETENAVSRSVKATASAPDTQRIFRQIDTNLNFSEMIFRPTTVLGYKADSDLITSVMGLLITGCLLAIQGFAETGFVYSGTGWLLN